MTHRPGEDTEATATSHASQSEGRGALEAYTRERLATHPLLQPHLDEAAVYLVGSVAFGAWDELSDLHVRIALSDEEHSSLAARLQAAHLWDPARDIRLRLVDREPFRRYPSAEVLILSASQLAQEFRFSGPVALWTHRHASVLADPTRLLAATVAHAEEEFQRRLDSLRCEHYYLFRQARSDLQPRLIPKRLGTLLAIKRGEAIREALRLSFLADGLPYPYDKWLEYMAERETRCGAGIVTACRALAAAREPHTLDRAAKVLRDRVIFGLQQGGVSEAWLEQWWLWPTLAPSTQ